MNPSPETTSSVRQILIVKPSSLGDIIHTFPLVSALRIARPGWSIDWVTNGEYLPLVRRNPDVRNVWDFPRREFGRAGFLEKIGRLRKNLSEMRYDIILDAQGLLRSALLSRMALGYRRTGIILGFDNAREGAPFFYTRKVAVPEHPKNPVHAVARNLLFLSALGIGPIEPPNPVLRYSPEDHAHLASLLSSQGIAGDRPYMVIHPGAKRESKKWPSAYFSELIRKMKGSGYPTPVLMGDCSEASLLSEIQLRSGTSVPVVAGKIPLDLLPLFLSRAALFVGNDSGPLHMAALSGIPTLSVFGSSDPGRTGPWGPGSNDRVQREDIACSPCGDFKKYCSHMTCQVLITPDRVLWEIADLAKQERVLP